MINTVKRLLQKHWKIILVLVLGLTPLLWFKPGFIMAKGDSFPFFAPSPNYQRFSYVWVDYDGVGGIPQSGNPLPSHSIWMGAWSVLSQFGLSLDSIQIILQVFYFLGAGLSMYFLASTIYKKEKITPLIASIFYMFNFFMILRTLNDGVSWCLVLLPLILAFYVRIINNVKNGQKTIGNIIVFSILSSITASFATINPPLLALIVMVFVAMFLYSIISQKGIRLKVIKTLGVILIVCLFINIWWIVPFSLQIIPYAKGSVALGTSIDVTSWSFVSARSSFLNLFWLNGVWSWRPGYFPYLADYSNPLLSILVFVPMIIGFAGLLFKSKYGKINLYFSATILILMFLSKGLHSPFENVNLFFYKYIPGFFLFREPFPKFYMLLIIPLALLIGTSVNAIGIRLKKFKIHNKSVIYNAFVIFIIGIFLVSTFPLLTGGVISGKTEQLPFSSYVKIPDYWYQASDYINGQKGNFRVLLTPGDDYYQMPYIWDYYGADALPPRLIIKPVIQQLSGGYTVNQDITSLIYEKIEANQTEDFVNLLSLLNVKYILQRNDVWWNFSSRTIVSPELMKSFLCNQTGITLEASFGDLDLYKVSDGYFLPQIYPATTSILINGSINEMSQVLSSDNSPSSNTAFFLSSQVNNDQSDFIGNFSSNPPPLTFEEVNPTKYEVKVENATNPFFLIFSESYDSQWKAYVSSNSAGFNKVVANYPMVNVKEADSEIKSAPGDISYLFESPINEQYHFIVNGYANAWYIDPHQLNNGAEQFTITLYYVPQSYYYLGLSVTGITLVICVGYLFYELKQRNLQFRKRLQSLLYRN